MRKIAFTLTNKKYNLQAGQRVALVYPNTEPIPFSCAFYGCLLSGLVPVVVEVPMHSEVSKQPAFALSHKCFKGDRMQMSDAFFSYTDFLGTFLQQSY